MGQSVNAPIEVGSFWRENRNGSIHRVVGFSGDDWIHTKCNQGRNWSMNLDWFRDRYNALVLDWRVPAPATRMAREEDALVGVNPKDLIGNTKPGMRNTPQGPLYEVSGAFDDGAKKYGAYNWRDKPVKASVYIDAAKRHMDSWYEREECAEDSGIHHLAHATACLLILLDAKQQNSLSDDRPKNNEPLAKILGQIKQQLEAFKEASNDAASAKTV